MKPAPRTPIYDATKDGNVFKWVLNAAQDFREVKQQERLVALQRLQYLQRAKNDNIRNKRI